MAEGGDEPADGPPRGLAKTLSGKLYPGQPPERRRPAGELPVVERGGYRIGDELGRGGLGRVMRASDEVLGRPVAIKELLDDSGDAAARFAREALITARLQHPAIVPVYQAGRWPSGEPFYAMKLVSGQPLEALIHAARTLEQRLALLPNLLAVADAMAYAHGQRVIHRDLKPANVLVGAFGETVVIDWGMAKDLADDGEHAPDVRTIEGTVLGTPVYMPPEQAAGEPVDERADVYALGAMLYHLLAGALPYPGPTALEVLRQVVSGPPEALARRVPELPRDLAAVVDKAMARAPADRYPTAREMADELRRFQTGQLVGAHEYGSWDLVRRFVARNRAAVTVAALAALAIAGLAAWSAQRIGRQRDRAERSAAAESALRAEADARIEALVLERARGFLDRDPTRALAWLKRLRAPVPGAATIAADAFELGVAERVLRGHFDRVFAVAFAPDGALLAAAGQDGALRLWDAASGAVRTYPTQQSNVRHLAFSPRGSLLATGGEDGSVRLWDPATGESRALRGHLDPVSWLAFSPDGRQLVSGGDDETVRLWPVEAPLTPAALPAWLEQATAEVITEGGEGQ